MEDIVNFIEDSHEAETADSSDSDSDGVEMEEAPEGVEAPQEAAEPSVETDIVHASDFKFDVGFYLDLDKNPYSKLDLLKRLFFFKPYSYDDGCDDDGGDRFRGQSVAQTEPPERVLIAGSILVSRVDSSTPNLFVSSPQEVGRIEEIDMVITGGPNATVDRINMIHKFQQSSIDTTESARMSWASRVSVSVVAVVLGTIVYSVF